jgi:hypothetical protein
MKLTKFVIDLGRPVAFYPGLKKITGSTTATIMLCQFLYWSTRTTNDGWTWKTSDDIENETGLTYNEQRTAREILVDKKLLEIKIKRDEHLTYYRVNEEELNKQWEEEQGKASEPITPVHQPSELEILMLKRPDDLNVKEKEPREIPAKKGDLVDLFIDQRNSPGYLKMESKKLIKSKLEKRLHINADSKKWEEFIEFIWGRETREKESVDTFLNWAVKDFNPIYWTPEKMKTLWPQAFLYNDASILDEFVKTSPEEPEEETAPMPEDLGREKKLF